MIVLELRSLLATTRWKNAHKAENMSLNFNNACRNVISMQIFHFSTSGLQKYAVSRSFAGWPGVRLDVLSLKLGVWLPMCRVEAKHAIQVGSHFENEQFRGSGCKTVFFQSWSAVVEKRSRWQSLDAGEQLRIAYSDLNCQLCLNTMEK